MGRHNRLDVSLEIGVAARRFWRLTRLGAEFGT